MRKWLFFFLSIWRFCIKLIKDFTFPFDALFHVLMGRAVSFHELCSIHNCLSKLSYSDHLFKYFFPDSKIDRKSQTPAGPTNSTCTPKVPRVFCHLPVATRPWQHENAIRDQRDSFRIHQWLPFILDLVVSLGCFIDPRRHLKPRQEDWVSSGSLTYNPCSLPGALGMYGLAVGIQRVDDTLPAPVYALITGLNAATVGIIALAAIQLSQKAIKDTLTRILVFIGGTAGMLYNALWYFPVLMFAGGIATILWDCRESIMSFFHKRRPDEEAACPPGSDELHDMSHTSGRSRPTSTHSRRSAAPAPDERRSQDGVEDPNVSPEAEGAEQLSRTISRTLSHRIFSWKFGICIAAGFFLTFIPIMILRGVLDPAPRGLGLFANMYLAGTIIFGGGPVVIPLLRE